MTNRAKPGYLKKFDNAYEHNSMKYLKEICLTDEQYDDIKYKIFNKNNAYRRDIMNKYIAEDYLGVYVADHSDVTTVNQVPMPTVPQPVTTGFAVGDRVQFGAQGHSCDGKVGTILQVRTNKFLIELNQTHRPDRRGNSTGQKIQIWAERMYLQEVGHGTIKAA